MGSAIGVMKIAASRVGVTIEEYQARVNAGEKYCHACRGWHPRFEFPIDRSRGDGLSAVCRSARAKDHKDQYIPKPRQHGRRLVAAREGDKRQARRRINFLVEIGALSRPNDLPCVDCGHFWRDGEMRHEYDHYLGYAPEHHEDVRCVCASCHRRRHGGLRGLKN